MEAVRLNADETITVDGRLDESVWKRAEPATNFRQSDPMNGAPATERTEIRIIFDREHLYIGAEFFDSDPNGLIGYQMLRDGALNADDRFMWTMDTFNDQRSGYYFEINPSGAMGDAQLVPAQGRNSGTQQNRAWNGIWTARVRRHDQGWTAEIDIPFRTLNFNPQAEAWGVNFQRTVRRKNEESFWTAWGRNQGLFNLNSSGRLVGISDVSQGLGLDVKPYVLGTYTETPGSTPSTYKGDGGLDLFYNVTPQLKMNVTFNTDFAQTEVDDRQVNLGRFPLFFPEKRDFFLESSGNFDFSREPQDDLTAFFTRRVGLVNGAPQKIDYGLKMAGQVHGFDLGLMQVRTGAEAALPGEDFTVFRPKHHFLSQSYAGLIYTRRTARDSNVAGRQSAGADFQLATSRFRGNQNLQVSGFFIKTPNPAKPTDNGAWGLRMDFPNDRWNGVLVYKEFEEHVDPAAGFVERTNYRKFVPGLRFAPRPKGNKWVRQIGFEARTELYLDRHNSWQERFTHLTLMDLNFQSGDQIFVMMEPHYERLDSDFQIGAMTLKQGTEYRYNRANINFNTANRRTISADVKTQVGSFYSGHRRDVSVGMNVRPRPGVLATLSSSFNRIELPEGNLSTKVLRAVINTQFSPFTSISNNIQYDSVSRVLGWQLRFRWILKAGNDVYFVWMNNWLDSGKQLTTLDRNAAMKIVYTQRF